MTRLGCETSHKGEQTMKDRIQKSSNEHLARFSPLFHQWCRSRCARKSLSAGREYLIPAVSRVELWWLELRKNHGVPGGLIINVDTRGVWLVSAGCALPCQRTLNFWLPARCLWTDMIFQSNEQINHALYVGHEVCRCCFSLHVLQNHKLANYLYLTSWLIRFLNTFIILTKCSTVVPFLFFFVKEANSVCYIWQNSHSNGFPYFGHVY